MTAISLTIPCNECAPSLLRWGMWICGCHGHATLGIMPIFKNTYFSHARAHKWQPASSCQPRRQWSRVIPNRVNCYLSHNCKRHWTALDQILLYLNVVPHPDNGSSEALLLQWLQGSVINHRSFWTVPPSRSPYAKLMKERFETDFKKPTTTFYCCPVPVIVSCLSKGDGKFGTLLALLKEKRRHTQRWVTVLTHDNVLMTCSPPQSALSALTKSLEQYVAKQRNYFPSLSTSLK